MHLDTVVLARQLCDSGASDSDAKIRRHSYVIRGPCGTMMQNWHRLTTLPSLHLQKCNISATLVKHWWGIAATAVHNCN